MARVNGVVAAIESRDGNLVITRYSVTRYEGCNPSAVWQEVFDRRATGVMRVHFQGGVPRIIEFEEKEPKP